MRLSVIIPVYNESETIMNLIQKVQDVPIEKEIIIVDDFSTDGTRKVLREIKDDQIRIFYHPKNQGKGAAVRTGFKEIMGDIAVIQDADLEYDPNEYTKLIQPIIDGIADVVYGSRFAGSSKRVLQFWHSKGNKFLTLLSNMFTNLDLTDMETCYKAFRSDVLQNIYLESNRFGFEPEITAKISKLNYRIYEVPISYHGRSFMQGKKIGWKDGVSAIYAVIKYHFDPHVTKSRVGFRSFARLQAATNYHRWLYDKISPFLGNKIFEIGSGTGEISKFLLTKSKVVLSDMNSEYLKYLKTVIPEKENIDVRQIDANDLPVEELKEHKFDTLLALHLIEHIQDDQKFLKDMFEILESEGKLILVVPANKNLYGTLDQSLNHFRRYEKNEICEKLELIGYDVEHAECFNLLGMLGWFINSKILRKKELSIFQLKVFDRIAPLLKYESIFQLRQGMSILIVAKKR